MIRRITIFVLVLMTNGLYGQTDATDALIAPHRPVELGGYMAPSVKYSPIMDKTGTAVGGRVALLVDHRYSLGAAVYGMLQRFQVGEFSPGVPLELYTGYGGLDLRFFSDTRDKINWSLDLLMGYGGMTISRNDGLSVEIELDDGYAVTEPGVSASINLTPFLILNGALGYRFVGGVEDNPWVSNKDLEGVTMTVSLLFGMF